MAKNKIKFAIIGYGRIGKRHATVLQRLPNAQLVAVCDIVAPQNASDDPSISFFNSIETLLTSNVLFDVAIIATPNGLHESQSVQLLEASMSLLKNQWL
jgi:predicted dehydrogenase